MVLGGVLRSHERGIFAACSPQGPPGKVMNVEQEEPQGTMTGENGSSRSKWIRAAMFRICSPFPKMQREMTLGIGIRERFAGLHDKIFSRRVDRPGRSRAAVDKIGACLQVFRHPPADILPAGRDEILDIVRHRDVSRVEQPTRAAAFRCTGPDINPRDLIARPPSGTGRPQSTG